MSCITYYTPYNTHPDLYIPSVLHYKINNTIIKLRGALFVTYTIIQSITSSEMCSLHLTHPSAHTWSSGQPTLRRPGSSWGFGALLKGLTSAVDNSCRSRDSNPQPRVTSPTLYPLGHDCPYTSDYCIFIQILDPCRESSHRMKSR